MAVADLAVGGVVLDPGSGGRIDVIASARPVGPTGMAYGWTRPMTVQPRPPQCRGRASTRSPDLFAAADIGRIAMHDFTPTSMVLTSLEAFETLTGGDQRTPAEAGGVLAAMSNVLLTPQMLQPRSEPRSHSPNLTAEHRTIGVGKTGRAGHLIMARGR